MDLSSNGKYLASCSEDRTVLVWHSKDFAAKEHKCLRCNVEFDHGVFISWSPDSKAFVVQKAVANNTEVYKMGKKPDGSMGDFSVAVSFPAEHKTDTVGMGISPSGRFLASCSDKTELIVWNLKGEILDKIGKILLMSASCHNFVYSRHCSQSDVLLPSLPLRQVRGHLGLHIRRQDLGGQVLEDRGL